MANTIRNVTIYDEPESKIQYLETLLKGQDWSANIVFPRLKDGKDPVSAAKELAATLESRGYATNVKPDESGHAVLHLRTIGSQTDFMHLIREMGLSKGLGYTITHFHAPLASALTGAYKYANHIVKEPARFFSGIYLLGDVMFTLSGTKNHKVQGNFFERLKQDVVSLKEPANLLQAASGKLALVQSLVYMKFANSGAELAYENLQANHKSHVDKGVDPTNISAWKVADAQTGTPSAFTQILKKHPIESGALAQIFGQLAFMGTSLLQLRNLPAHGTAEILKSARGAKINIARSLTAITAWSMFMKKPHHTEQKTNWNEAPTQRAWQEFSEHPERFASVINTAASGIGLWAASEKGNNYQRGAELLWLAGDIIMFFAKSSHYGGTAARQEEPMIEAATRFLKELPLALSPEAEKAYIGELSHYLATHSLNERNAKSDDKLQGEAFREECNRLTHDIETGIHTALIGQETRYDRVITQTARLVERFENAERPAIAKRMAEAFHHAQGIYGNTKEIEASILKRLQPGREVGGTVPPTMGDLKGDIQAVVASIPGITAPHVALAIYDALKPSIQPGRFDLEQLDKHLRKEAAHTLGVPSHALEPGAGNQSRRA